MESSDRIVDYFVVSGVAYSAKSFDDNSLDLSLNSGIDPIVEIAVVNRTLEEEVPKDFVCIETTPSGFIADLNHGSILTDEMFICVRRSRTEPPITDIGIFHDGKEKVRKGCHVVTSTVGGHVANINNANSPRIYLTAEFASDLTPIDALVVTDVCVILANKNEAPPHTFYKIPKAVNTALVGSDVHVCYKKTSVRVNSLMYTPAILCRYPLTDHTDFSLPANIATFCLPLGAEIVCGARTQAVPYPQFFSFVLTSEGGTNAYGAVLMFYERVNLALLTAEQRKALALKEADPNVRVVYTTKSICVISRLPFFEAFHTFLSYLHKLTFFARQPLPIERHISHFMTQVPLPSSLRPQVHVQLSGEEELLLYLPHESALPLSGASFVGLLRTLSVDNVILLMIHVLLEHKIIIHSLRPTYLTGIAEAARMIVFPFRWQCVYVPLCPLSLADFLSAPLPFIVGIDSRYFDIGEKPTDAVFIDLDTNTIFGLEEFSTFGNKFLPKKAAKQLKTTLEALVVRIAEEGANSRNTSNTSANMSLSIELDIARHRKRRSVELAIQEAFLHFMASCFQGYRSFLRPITGARNFPTTDLESLFDTEGFLRSQEKGQQRFYQLLMKTQLFARFIEERSFASDRDTGLTFFDDYIDKLTDKGGSKKISDRESKQSSQTIFVMPPVPADGDTVMYSYERFPELQAELFESGDTKTSHLPVNKPLPSITSPHLRRTKQELVTSHVAADKTNPELWAKCLMWHTYSLWFIHLPAYVRTVRHKATSLRLAFDILDHMQQLQLVPLDEVCYRVLMQQCGIHYQPGLTANVLAIMKDQGIAPNAVTYGIYNKAVFDSVWQSPETLTTGRKRWRRLRHVIVGVRILCEAVKERYAAAQPHTTGWLVGASSDYTLGANTNETMPLRRISDPTPPTSSQIIGSTPPGRLADTNGQLPTMTTPNVSADTNNTSPLDSLPRSNFNTMPRISPSKSVGNTPTATPTKTAKSRFGNSLLSASSALASQLRSLGRKDTPGAQSAGDLLSDSGATQPEASAPLRGSLDQLNNRGSPLSAVRGTLSRSATLHQTITSTWAYVKQSLRQSMALSADNLDDLAYDTDPTPRISAHPTSDTVARENPTFNTIARENPTSDNVAKENLTSNTGVKENTSYDTSKTPSDTGEVAAEADDEACTLLDMAIPAPEDEGGEVVPSSISHLHPASSHSSLHSAVSQGALYPSSSVSTLPQLLHNVGLDVEICSQSTCGSCSSLLYDEEIMAGWSADLSDFSTSCVFCGKKLVPQLNIYIKDLRKINSPYQTTSRSTENISRQGDVTPVLESPEVKLTSPLTAVKPVMPEQQSNNTTAPLPELTVTDVDQSVISDQSGDQSEPPKTGEVIGRLLSGRDSTSDSGSDITDGPSCDLLPPISMPYLSALVLRKELETVIDAEGDQCLNNAHFVDNHSIIYWNLVYCFARLRVASHLPGLLLSAQLTHTDTVTASRWAVADSKHVCVRAVWDNLRLQQKLCRPLYVLWRNSVQLSLSSEDLSGEVYDLSVMKRIYEALKVGDLFTPINLILDCRQRHLRHHNPLAHFRSIYRDLLFFSLTALDKRLGDFELLYQQAYASLSAAGIIRTRPYDKPPNEHVRACTRLFPALLISP